MDIITPITPVQNLEIKGIASGLTVQGSGSVWYSFYNDSGELDTICLKHFLNIPQCTARPLCPRQLGVSSQNPSDGFTSIMYHSVLTHCGKCTRIPYNKITNLPIFYTASRMSSLHHFCAKQSYLTQVMSSNPHPTFHSTNLTPAQWQKLYWHEHCAHVGFDQLNTWIRKGSLPCNPRLSQEPNPIYTACQFGKSHKKLRLSNIGHISDNHTAPGDGVSTYGMEAGTLAVFSPPVACPQQRNIDM